MAGIPCAGGSDAPVELAEPFLGIYDSIFRPAGSRDPKNLQQFRSVRIMVYNKLFIFCHALVFFIAKSDYNC